MILYRGYDVRKETVPGTSLERHRIYKDGIFVSVEETEDAALAFIDRLKRPLPDLQTRRLNEQDK